LLASIEADAVKEWSEEGGGRLTRAPRKCNGGGVWKGWVRLAEANLPGGGLGKSLVRKGKNPYPKKKKKKREGKKKKKAGQRRMGPLSRTLFVLQLERPIGGSLGKPKGKLEKNGEPEEKI